MRLVEGARGQALFAQIYGDPKIALDGRADEPEVSRSPHLQSK